MSRSLFLIVIMILAFLGTHFYIQEDLNLFVDQLKNRNQYTEKIDKEMKNETSR